MIRFMSLPSRERGLKSGKLRLLSIFIYVAPFAGAWIEISQPPATQMLNYVAPFAGAWIEMVALWWYPLAVLIVAPFAGAWIEIK